MRRLSPTCGIGAITKMEYNTGMINLLAALVPYAAVLIGMYAFRSAWLAVLLYHLGILAFIAIRRPSCLKETLWSGARNPLTLPAVTICALAAPVVYFLWPLFQPTETVLPEWMARYGLSGMAWLLLIPYFSIVHPILEEIHWRKIAPERFVWLCWQDLLFAGYHVVVLGQLVYWPWLFFVFGVLAGSSVFWRWAANRFGGYGLAVLTHAAADAGVVIGIYFLLK